MEKAIRGVDIAREKGQSTMAKGGRGQTENLKSTKTVGGGEVNAKSSKKQTLRKEKGEEEKTGKQGDKSRPGGGSWEKTDQFKRTTRVA